MKTVVVLSGGMDSTTALALVVKEQNACDVLALTFNYGSKHNEQENLAAVRIAGHYGVEHTIVSLPFIGQLFKSDLLLTGGDVPEGHYEAENMKKTVVPFRNGIMLSIAAGFAESRGCGEVVIGSHAGDHAIYPDCRDIFMTPFAEAIRLGTWEAITLRRPFEKCSKSDIVREGTRLRVPYDLTWSCYRGGQLACGRCGTDVERLEAFDLAGEVDPIAYTDRGFYKRAIKT